MDGFVLVVVDDIGLIVNFVYVVNFFKVFVGRY